LPMCRARRSRPPMPARSAAIPPPGS
jgi:hypothetical protein